MSPHRTSETLDFPLRLFKEILNHSRGKEDGLAGHPLDRPSLTELLTIQQCGFPRTYNLNDGMGLD